MVLRLNKNPSFLFLDDIISENIIKTIIPTPKKRICKLPKNVAPSKKYNPEKAQKRTPAEITALKVFLQNKQTIEETRQIAHKI